jgi:hypothetical protein
MSAFILTGNPDNWPPEYLDELEQEATDCMLGEDLGVGEWSTHQKKNYMPGDRVYVLLQGNGPRGFFASGYVTTGEVFTNTHFADSSRTANYVDVAWDSSILLEEALPTSVLMSIAPNTGWTPRAGGTRIDSVDEAAVETAWQDHLYALGYPSSGEPREPLITPPQSPVAVPTGYALALVKVRKHQRAFRRLLLEHYSHECSVCGLDVVEILEAAHLKADKDGGEASVENGRLLCPNHHRALDSKLLEYDRRTKSFKSKIGSTVIPPVRDDQDVRGDTPTATRL